MSQELHEILELIKKGNDGRFITELEVTHAATFHKNEALYTPAIKSYKKNSRAYHKGTMPTHEQQVITDGLNAVISAAPPLSRWLYVCHGYGMPEVIKGVNLADIKEGQLITSLSESYISTTTDCSISCMFNIPISSSVPDQRVILHLFLPPGTKGFYIGPIEEQLSLIREHEFLLPPGMTFKVILVKPQVVSEDYELCKTKVYFIYAVAVRKIIIAPPKPFAVKLKTPITPKLEVIPKPKVILKPAVRQQEEEIQPIEDQSYESPTIVTNVQKPPFKVHDTHFMPYPDISDPDFYEKIYLKKEFYKTKAQPLGTKTIEEMCDRSQFNLENFQEFVRNYISSETNYNGLLMFWGVGTGKCVLPETDVYVNGNLETIQWIWEQFHNQEIIHDEQNGEWSTPIKTLYINTYDQQSGHMIERPVHRLYRQIISEKINVIKLKNGQQLKLTQQHHLLTENGWTNQLNNVKFVAIPRILLNRENVTSVGVNLAYFLGWHMACGHEYCDHDELIITNLSNQRCHELTDVFCKICDQYKLNNYLYLIERYNDKYCLKIKCPDYINLLKNNGYKWGQAPVDRSFPKSLMNAEIDEIKAFLKSYCDSVLFINTSTGRLELPPMSPICLKQLYFVFKLFGINLTMYMVGKYMSGYIDVDNIINYYDEIGYLSTEKNDSLTYLLGTKSHIPDHKNDSIMMEISSVHTEMYDGYVYDLEIDQYHNYVANGFICHNTCGAMQIAEGLKEHVKKLGKKIYVLTNKRIKPNFMRELYDHSKIKDEIIPGSKQCVGDAYYLQDPKLDETQLVRKINSNIGQYYKFAGLRKFVNDIDKLKEKPTFSLGKYFSNSVIIIDEAHSLNEKEETEDEDEDEGNKKVVKPKKSWGKRKTTSKKTTEAEEPLKSAKQSSKAAPTPIIDMLHQIFEQAKGIKLILLTATPMKDTADDLYVLLDLLHINDKRPPIDKNRLFPPGATTLSQESAQYLKEVAKGYVSYVRGENPINFPKIVDVANDYIEYETIQKDQKTYLPHPPLFSDGTIFNKSYMQHIKLIRCPMELYQFMYYLKIMENPRRDQSDSTGRQVCNIVFPSGSEKPDAKKYGHDGLTGAFTVVSTEVARKPHRTKKTATGTERTPKVDQYVYGPNVPKDFLQKKNIGQYSKKFEIFLRNVIKSRGIIYTYSEFIDSGANIIAMMLEANGYQRYIGMSNNKSLLLEPIPEESLRCSKCGKRQGKHPSQTCTVFNQAYYMLFTGKVAFSQKDIDVINGLDNANGDKIKIIVGTHVSGEGINYVRIREVHIMDPWHNNTRLFQVIGRAARHCSHLGLPPDQRKVTVFRYCSAPPDVFYQYHKNFATISKSGGLNQLVPSYPFTFGQLFRETVDEKVFRRIERKDRFVKQVERVLKISAVDCALNKNINIFDTDVDGTRVSDYTNHNYMCEGRAELIKDLKINTDTYNLYFSEPQIIRIQRDLSNLFKFNFAMTLENIIYVIKKHHPDIEETFVYEALDRIIGNPPQKNPILLRDRFDRPGHLIFSNPYYIFQPEELADPKAPLYYKSTPLTIKKKFVNLEPVKNVYRTKVTRPTVIQAPVIDLNITKIADELVLFSQDKELGKYRVQAKLDRLSPAEQAGVYEEIKSGKKYGTSLKDWLIEYFTKLEKLFIYELPEKIIEYVGHHINGTERIYVENGWINAEDAHPDQQKRIANAKATAALHKPLVDTRKFGSIIGFIHDGKFKIIDAINEHKKMKISRQPMKTAEESEKTLKTGKVCTTYNLDDKGKGTGSLKQFAAEVGFEHPSNVRRADLCEMLELKCREKDEKDKEYRWFCLYKETPRGKKEAAMALAAASAIGAPVEKKPRKKKN